MQTKPVAMLNLKWTKQLTVLLVLLLIVGCSTTKSRTTYSSDPEEILEHNNQLVSGYRALCVSLIDSLESLEPKRNVDYAYFLDKSDSFSNLIQMFLEHLLEPQNHEERANEFPLGLMESVYDSLRVFENYTNQSLCPIENDAYFFNLPPDQVRNSLEFNSKAVRMLFLIKTRYAIYSMLASYLACLQNK